MSGMKYSHLLNYEVLTTPLQCIKQQEHPRHVSWSNRKPPGGI